MIRFEDLKIGDRVTYRNFGGQFVTGNIIDLDPDIKRGQSGFDLDNGRWGYTHQIVSIHEKAEDA